VHAIFSADENSTKGHVNVLPKILENKLAGHANEFNSLV